MACFQILTRLELGILVSLAEVALDAAIGKGLQLRSTIDGFDVAKVVAHHAEQLLHVLQAEMLHDHSIDFRRTLMLDRNAVVAASLEGAQYSFS
jgi:hypothetical protein